MKHIGTTTENETIVTLTIKDIQDLETAANAASILYDRDCKENPEDRGAMILRKMMNTLWVKLYDLEQTLV